MIRLFSLLKARPFLFTHFILNYFIFLVILSSPFFKPLIYPFSILNVQYIISPIQLLKYFFWLFFNAGGASAAQRRFLLSRCHGHNFRAAMNSCAVSHSAAVTGSLPTLEIWSSGVPLRPPLPPLKRSTAQLCQCCLIPPSPVAIFL